MNTFISAGAIAATAAVASAQSQEFTFPMPPLNQEFFFDSGFIPGAPDFAGGTVTDARVTLSITVEESPPGDPRVSGAEHFYTEIVFPVDTDPVTPGVQAYVGVIDGAAEGWSGLGTFTIDREIPELLGGEFIVPLLFTATTLAGNDSTTTVNLAEPLNPDIAVPPFVVDDGWFMTVTVPTPGVGAVAALGALALTRRRRV